MNWIAALIGVAVGYAITSYVDRRRFAAVFELLRSDIVNTSAPTTAELNLYPDPCPRCGRSMFLVDIGDGDAVPGHDCEP